MFRQLKLLALLPLVAFVLLGCSNKEDSGDLSIDIASIEFLEKRFNDTYLTRDWDAFASCFTDDGVWMPPDIEPLIGKDEWWDFVKTFWEFPPDEVESQSIDLVISGDWAIESHREKIVYYNDDEEPTIYRFKAVHVLHRQTDNSWKITRYIWNTDGPA